jgi:hypothetical protein
MVPLPGVPTKSGRCRRAALRRPLNPIQSILSKNSLAARLTTISRAAGTTSPARPTPSISLTASATSSTPPPPPKRWVSPPPSSKRSAPENQPCLQPRPRIRIPFILHPSAFILRESPVVSSRHPLQTHPTGSEPRPSGSASNRPIPRRRLGQANRQVLPKSRSYGRRRKTKTGMTSSVPPTSPHFPGGVRGLPFPRELATGQGRGRGLGLPFAFGLRPSHRIKGLGQSPVNNGGENPGCCRSKA